MDEMSKMSDSQAEAVLRRSIVISNELLEEGPTNALLTLCTIAALTLLSVTRGHPEFHKQAWRIFKNMMEDAPGWPEEAKEESGGP
jgi:hypothetical protein